ncbi:MAG TPA: protein translocase subunit SecF [Candidatus Sulfotelmatobacter sp.]|nr:protein translocase subunit SecF [Candidatus Sulfotelmatobacter sp.]
MIELFKQPNIDWMGKAKYFFALSGLLLIIGWSAIFLKGGIKYGIDFKGGTNVDVVFAQPPNIDKLRSGLRSQGLNNAEIQSISSSGLTSNSNEVLIFVEQSAQTEQALDDSKAKVLTALRGTYGVAEGKPDFNSVTPNVLANFLLEKDPLGLGLNAGDKYQTLAKNLLSYRDREKGGVLGNLSELSQATGATPAVVSTIENNYSLAPFGIRGVEIVGPKVGAELRNQAIRVTLYALAGMLVYIAFRFYGGQIGGSATWSSKGGFLLRFVDRIIFGVAAVLAVFHDVLITLGLFKIFGFEISLTVIAALLTLVGYSMNDTIVIFDRIRENNRLLRKEAFADVVNKSINQTLSRTILTSGLTFLTVLVLFLMGGQVLRAFSFALVVGIVVGTYSSFGIAAPLVVAWNRWRGHGAGNTGTAAGNKSRGNEGGATRLAPAGRR